VGCLKDGFGGYYLAGGKRTEACVSLVCAGRLFGRLRCEGRAVAAPLSLKGIGSVKNDSVRPRWGICGVV
jgi:hypothetical protein